MKRVWAAVAVVAIVALCAGIGPAFGRTSARVLPATCKVGGTVRFSPPLGQTAQTTKHIYTNADSKIKSCVLSTAKGTFAGTLTGTGSCVKATATGTLTFTWNIGPASTASVKFKSLTHGKGSLTGKVKAGQYKGTAVTGILKFTVVKGSCTSGPGVRLASFTGKVTI